MSMLNPSRSRLLQLEKLRAQIFNHTFNPSKLRTGAKVLRAPLKGEHYRNWYYPDIVPTPKQLKKIFPDLNPSDPAEDKRLAKVAAYVIYS
jgi:small subunit ribosomal protein S33